MVASSHDALTPSEPSSTPSSDDPTGVTDGRLLRRARNRDAVVDALLELYRAGNFRPSTEEIAGRSDGDDLTRTAIARFEQQALALLPIDAPDGAGLTTKAGALVDQRFRLFDAVGPAATVSRLHAPFQPILARELSRNRAFLRQQITSLFAPELALLPPGRAVSVLAAADVLCSFESYDLLLGDQGLTPMEARTAMTGALTAVFEPPR